ncbi:MAG: DUF1844 domain-containing protein [Planctomycetota bacterium]|nr:DUF1844 domain-containing protein [Planctomycetota bacterium]
MNRGTDRERHDVGREIGRGARPRRLESPELSNKDFIMTQPGNLGGPPTGGNSPKIIVDTDWKAQAQAQKAQVAKPTPPSAPAAATGLEVDSDWKAQAQAEKERLSQAAAPKGERAKRGMPEEPGFEDLISLLATQALTYLGAFPDPRTGQAMVSIEAARLYIDLLGVVEAKTKGNLSEQETTMLTRILTELRMEAAEVAKVVAKAYEEGRIRQVPAGGMGRGPGAGLGGGGLGGAGLAGQAGGLGGLASPGPDAANLKFPGST